MKTQLLSFLLMISLAASAGNTPFQQRCIDYTDRALVSPGREAIVLQAGRGLPVDTGHLNTYLRGVPTKGTVDFDLVQLVRVLMLAPGQYDAQILPVILQLPYWVTAGDTLHGYWSENHMIMWSSSDWLLHEYYNKPLTPHLRQRIIHYLRLKKTYGFYEFMSSVYAPYCLTGILNLADFSQDQEIKSLAADAALELMKELLLVTNDRGVYYPVAGRNYYGKYDTPYGQNHNHLIWLLSGLGDVPGGASHAGPFLATTTIDVEPAIQSWTANLDIEKQIGHTITEGIQINDTLNSEADKTMFQWSCGGYFHPAVAARTVNFLFDSSLWYHVDFEQFRDFSTLPRQSVIDLCNTLTVASMSTVISGQTLHIFKKDQLTLASVKNFWKGKLGFQQFPCVANVGTTPVMLASGKTAIPWSRRNGNNANEHLPYVDQKHNVALIMYRAEPKPNILPYRNPEIAIYFNDSDFDEVRENGPWLLGRQGKGYVGVRRHCIDSIGGVRGCEYTGGQAWAIVVGDSDMYGGFNQFETLATNSTLNEQWYVQGNQSIYEASLQFDTISISHAWGTDTSFAVGLQDSEIESGLRLQPNPANDQLSVLADLAAGETFVLNIFSLSGQLMKHESGMSKGNKIPTVLELKGLPAGNYMLQMLSEKRNLRQKLIIQH